MATVQKVGAVLKKAGFCRANLDYMASGFWVRQRNEAVHVSFIRASSFAPGNKADMHSGYAKALLAVGFEVEDKGNRLIVK